MTQDSPSPNIDPPSWMSKVLDLYALLVRPHPSITEIGARLEARFQSTLLLICVVSICSGSLRTFANQAAEAPFLASLTAAIALCYLLTRTEYYRLGLRLAVLVMLIFPFLLHFVAQETGDQTSWGELVWLVLPVTLLGLSFPIRVALSILGVVLMFLIVSAAWDPHLSFFSAVELASLCGSLGILITLVWHHRNLIEAERLSTAEARKAEVAHSAELEQLNQNMQTLLYIVSHDLKEPLRSIRNFSRIVNSRYAKQLPDKGKDYLQRVERAANRMQGLLDDLLELSRAQRAKPPDEPIASEDIVEATLEGLSEAIRETDASVSVVGPFPSIRVDSTWASRCLHNLVANALKYSDASSPPEVEIAGYDGPEGSGFAVRDRGPGVKPEDQDRIFEMFQRAVGRDVEGTGAGLAIVRRIAERHGGQAWVNAREDGGSVFIVTFAGES